MKKYIFSVIIIMLCFLLRGQNAPLPENLLKQKISIAFDKVEKDKSIYFVDDLKKKLEAEYYTTLLTLDPNEFYYKEKAKKTIEEYSEINGIENLIIDFIESEKYKDSFTLSNKLYMKVYFSAKNPDIDAKMVSDVNDKYATLIVEVTPDSPNACIYLNNRFICTVKQAKNGLKINSNKSYDFELRYSQRTYCKSTVKLKGEEIQTNSCSLEN